MLVPVSRRLKGQKEDEHAVDSGRRCPMVRDGIEYLTSWFELSESLDSNSSHFSMYFPRIKYE